MSADPQPASTSKAMLWAGYIVSALPLVALVPSGIMKVMKTPEVIEGFEKFGFDPSVIVPIGVVELACAVLYLIPRTSVLGAILITGYLGGATVTHLRAGEAFIAPIVVGVLAWLGLFLRDARLRALVPWRR